MTTKLSTLHAAVLRATPEQRRLLRLPTRQYAMQLVTGHRKASRKKAAAIEHGSREANATDLTFPVVDRAEVCDDCRDCPHAQKHLGGGQ